MEKNLEKNEKKADFSRRTRLVGGGCVRNDVAASKNSTSELRFLFFVVVQVTDKEIKRISPISLFFKLQNSDNSLEKEN